MPFIGNQPAKVPLTSADITDGIITNADIANSTINLTTKVTGSLPVANGGTGLTALGSSLQVLRTNTGATALEFATISTGAAAGQVIQVLSSTDQTQRTTTSSTFVTGSNTLSVTITPASSSNKIFIIVGATFAGTFLSNSPIYGEDVYFTIYRDSTNLGNGNNGLGYTNMSHHPSHLSYLDSPNTTSAITYQVYFRTAGSTAYINGGSSKGSITCMEVKG